MRALIVEDQPDLLFALRGMLEDEGYAVDTAADGESGLHRALVWEYDVIVLDWMLPRLSGFDLLKQLRAKKSTPVLMLTARDGVADRVQGLDQGADDYLVKPFDRGELLARLRALIRRAAGESESLLELGQGVTINLIHRKVFRDDVEIVLTAREYSIFEYLALHRGRVVPRTDLYDHIFDENDESLSNLLDVHISNLRRKLGRDVIETRRGLGYIIHSQASSAELVDDASHDSAS
ncbi:MULTISPECIES: response regulator transcription factor [Planctopirus]|jgi:two-component system OmpR family response regulator|uniref:DNA-binding response regulator n=2 Tax=Planctopirus TaxID=1649480 RepID=A0A1C3EN16_9PLAN|nr:MULTISPECIES: response regulator transcription factor [Planctopirus]ODA34637.1 DNA-binding response regulator [Planctopirus hydrillae]QDV28918.1 Transcriptional activator protein CzcR [Planctopirus ephydatiae]